MFLVSAIKIEFILDITLMSKNVITRLKLTFRTAIDLHSHRHVAMPGLGAEADEFGREHFQLVTHHGIVIAVARQGLEAWKKGIKNKIVCVESNAVGPRFIVSDLG